MSQRVDRVSAEIRNLLGEIIVRGEIKDPRVSTAGLITFTHVRVTGDLREARALFTVHDADEATLEKVKKGLESASGFMRRVIGSKLRLKVTPSLTFEIDRVFDQGAKIDALLREVATPGAQASKPKE